MLSARNKNAHVWKFFRTGGFDQVALEKGPDLLALSELDQKLWVALCCPVKGLELDEKTLALIDTDSDGDIRVPELIAAVTWAATRLKSPDSLLNGGSALPLEAINDSTPDGKELLASARLILTRAGTPDAATISVGDNSASAKLIADSAFNGDGIITPEGTADLATKALISDIIATVGGVPDRKGTTGVDKKKVAEFFKELAAYDAWAGKGAAAGVAPLGAATADGFAAIKAVRQKVDDFFARCRLAAFDARALGAMNRQESEYLAIAAKDLSISAVEIAALPLARVEAGKSLPLHGPVNPAWAAALETLGAAAVVPIYGAAKSSLTETEWEQLTTQFAAYEKWLKDKDGAIVEKLGAARARELLAGTQRAKLAKLIADDEAIANIDRLARYYRDLPTLLRNFVNFADFYSPDRTAIFQAGLLYLDSRACELCLRVEDPAAHAVFAAMSKIYVVYLDCTRKDGAMKIAACFTQGDSDYLFVGRNGLFYDRQGRDWHATITKIIDTPISIRQAFWSPYKKVIRMVEEQVAKRATAADAAATTHAVGAATTLPPVDPKAPAAPATPAAPAAPPPPKRFDVGTIAALGVGLGAIMTFFATVFAKFVELPAWQIPLVVIAIIFAISLPSTIIAWLKLRQRTLGPLLEANGWAINGRVKINIPFGAKLTQRAALPPGAKHIRHDPYEDKAAVRRRRIFVTLVVLAFAGLIAAYALHTWPFHAKPPAPAASDTPATPAQNIAPPAR